MAPAKDAAFRIVFRTDILNDILIDFFFEYRVPYRNRMRANANHWWYPHYPLIRNIAFRATDA